MNQKQTKRYNNLNHKTKKCNTKTNNDTNYEGCSRRPTLYSSEDVERMSVESSRARLMMQLVSPEELSEKTDSYFSKSNIIPAYVMISQTDIPVSRRNFSTYPTLVQGLRWDPSIDTYSEDSQANTSDDDRKFKCKCHRCKMKKCVAQKNLEKNKNCFRFKDNIAKFSDISTMTRNLRESGCGVRTPLPRANTSNVSISTSDVTIKDVLRIQTPQTYPINLAPVLKKSDFETNPNLDKEMKHRVSVALEDTINTNLCSDYENLLKSYAEKSMVLAPSNEINEDTRKVLYNEGISNSIANNTLPNVPLRTKRIKSQLKFDYSNPPTRTHRHLGGKQSVIPYTHRKNSKYHYDCKETKPFYNGKIQEDSSYLAISPVPMKPEKCDYMPSIRLPRRVLTSERNIEAFMDKRPIKMSSALK